MNAPSQMNIHADPKLKALREEVIKLAIDAQAVANRLNAHGGYQRHSASACGATVAAAALTLCRTAREMGGGFGTPELGLFFGTPGRPIDEYEDDEGGID